MDGGRVLRTGTTKEVFADPQSITAARLTGCKNILPCTRVDAHTVRLTRLGCPAAPCSRGAGTLHCRGDPRPRPCALRTRERRTRCGKGGFQQ